MSPGGRGGETRGQDFGGSRGALRTVEPATSQAPPNFDDIKDKIVQNLQNEVRMNQVRERDYSHVQSLIADLKARIRAQEHSNEEAQKDFSTRLEAQERTVKYYEGDIDSLKEQAKQKDDEGRGLYENILQVKDDIAAKDGEIYGTGKDLNNEKDSNETLRQIIAGKTQDLHAEQDRKKDQSSRIYE
jgi:chromosome segregation ATPase